MENWTLLSFSQKYTLDMTKISLNRKDVKKNTKFRLFLAKPKSPNEVIHSSDQTFRYNDLNIRLSLQFKCLKTENNDRWNGIFKYELINHPISGKKDKYIHIDTFIGNENNTLELEEDSKFLEISDIKEDTTPIINFRNEIIKLTLELNKENMTVNGEIYINIGVTIKDYHNLLNQPILKNNYLPSDHYYTIRAMYKVIKKNSNKYTGSLCPDFLSKDSVDIDPPEEIEFTYKNIFQIDQFVCNKYDCKSTENVTDWSGQCLNPNVRTMLEPQYHVRCRIVDKEGNDCCRPYFIILDCLDKDHFYGELQDPYNQGYDSFNHDRMLQFTIMKLSFNSISEIPLSWQSKEKETKLEPYLLDTGYSMTGGTVM
ncbi:hypothetical protein QKU48_gp1011 [Fadolivirus algeromassiliense]|jgi:hypothetical protein|uniref:Uncharacterized protein n=1 Tax=Fadolivirus FV1/VV64 TaxID=3070911 RepID=A0A7D3UVX8_9VIRU|nr:hypothetical protein QKU48_gp1011 [Fadolivirus algeromassiliense]QKF94469.1 hypothetical protein Fadolivirus_1_1011 [Fadolivirus FV1/VV64]